MRNLYLGGLAIAALLVACGGSSGDVKAARTAHYKGDKMAIFNAAKSAVEQKYPLEKTDENALMFSTVGRWYTPEGLKASERMDDIREVPDKSIHIAYIVALRPDGDAFVVDIKPKMYRLHAGSPQPEPLTEDDISVPGFAHGQIEKMTVEVHDALKQFEVQSVPATVPAGTSAPAPAPAPAAPAPAAPAPAAPAPQ